MRHITAVILAAGEGKRIKPIITPKPLISFLGKPIVQWVKEDLMAAGVKNFCLVVNPTDQSKFDFLLDKKTQIAVQAKPKGMADALLSAESKIKDNSIIVVNADDLLSLQTYKTFIKTIKKHKKTPFVTGLKTEKHLEAGYFKLKNNQVVGIIEKPAKGYEPSQYVNLVLHYFPNAANFFKLLKSLKSSKDDLYEKALDKLMKNQSVSLNITDEYVAPVKYPHHLLEVTRLILKHRLHPKSAIHPTAKIMSGAVIKNSYIGKDVIIGNNCLVRDSIIEEGSVVGYNTEIARSYVGKNNYFHCNYVGDSVIEGNSNLGSGARLANFRFDQKEVLLQQEKAKIETKKIKFGAILAKGVKLGINTSIMPGITIGQNSIIGSGVVLSKPIGKNKQVFVKQSLAIS